MTPDSGLIKDALRLKVVIGIEPAGRYGLQCQWEVPDEAFMVPMMNPEKMQGVKGVARYRPEFDAAM